MFRACLFRSDPHIRSIVFHFKSDAYSIKLDKLQIRLKLLSEKSCSFNCLLRHELYALYKTYHCDLYLQMFTSSKFYCYCRKELFA